MGIVSGGGGGGGLPAGITSPATGTLKLVPTSNTVTAVEIDSPIGSTALGTTGFVLFDETGNHIAELDMDGSTAFNLATTSSVFVVADNSSGPGPVIKVAGGAKLGFYNKAPVVLQTGVAVTAAGIHAALVNLGLITA